MGSAGFSITATIGSSVPSTAPGSAAALPGPPAGGGVALSGPLLGELSFESNPLRRVSLPMAGQQPRPLDELRRASTQLASALAADTAALRSPGAAR